MQCVVLAGGLGTRMLPRTEATPKTLLEVSGAPFASHQLRLLAGQGVRRVVYSIGHLGQQIRAFVGDGRRFGLEEVCYVDEGDCPMGTAGALRQAMESGALAERFFLLYGDSYLPTALAPIWAAADGHPALMTVHRNEGRWDASNVVFRNGRVVLYEKGRPDAAAIGMDHIDYGLAVLTRGTASEIPAGRQDLADFYHRLSREGRLAGYEVAERFYEIGSPAGLAELEAYLGHRHRGLP
ncbi:MAG: NTP transferase domain-containing protein [Magnetospirillum sp. WYHS-4]